MLSVSTLAHSGHRPSTGVRVLVVDNHDSFTGSLVQLLRVLGAIVVARRSDDLAGVPFDQFGLLLLSPGPGRPEERPINAWLAREVPAPVFGVCLGLQAIAEAWGGRVVPARHVVHGRTSRIHHAGVGAFAGLPSPLRATRYHSLAAERGTLPDRLEVTAWTADGEVMGLRHRDLPVEGVQFHPESVRTHQGLALLRNVLSWASTAQRPGADESPPARPSGGA
jgi:anthranilate synthase/aminodeoxychorismate synthase-like glutamine amidotransferase